MQLDKKVIKLI